jgi:hypothetical protein
VIHRTLTHAPPEGGGRARLSRRALATVAAAYVATRLADLAAIAWGAHQLHAPLASRFWLWDARWYRIVATAGYPRAAPAPGQLGEAARSPVAFFPGYPLIVRALRAVPGVGDAGQLAVAVGCGLAATVLAAVVLRGWWPEREATLGAVAVAAFPGAAVLSLGYAEGLLLLLVAGSLLLAARGRWLAAGLAAAAASATHPTGLTLVAPLAFAALLAIRRQGAWSALLAPALAPLGFAAYLLFLRVHTGQLDTWFRVERQGWGQRVDLSGWFASRLLHQPGALLAEPGTQLSLLGYALVAVLLAVAAVGALRGRTLPALLGVQALAVLLALFADSHVGPRPRLLLAAFPLVALPARVLGRRAAWAYVAASAVVQAACAWWWTTPGHPWP